MRFYDWFFEEEGTPAYKQQYAFVQQGLESFAWKALRGLVVDTRLWVGDHTWLRFAKPVDSHHVRGQFFVEFTGQLRWVYDDKGTRWFDFVDNDTHTRFPFPLTAIVSYRSTGFPKVAYSSEQYLIGYITILNWLEVLIDPTVHVFYPAERRLPIFKEGFHLSTIRPHNMHRDVYAIYASLVQEIQQGRMNDGDTMRPWYDKLYTVMVETMKADMVEHNKPPYHHTIEWHMDERILHYNHPFVKEYLALRKQYPTMIVGNGFIEVKG